MVQYYTDLHALETGSLPLVKSVATMFADVIYKNKDRLMAGVIVAGWDKKVTHTIPYHCHDIATQ
jgi:20S proteasome subunit beta 1